MKERLEQFCKEMFGSGILYDEAVREFKKMFIHVALDANRGNQCKAARQLGKHRNTLGRTMAELHIPANRPQFTRAERLEMSRKRMASAQQNRQAVVV